MCDAYFAEDYWTQHSESVVVGSVFALALAANPAVLGDMARVRAVSGNERASMIAVWKYGKRGWKEGRKKARAGRGPVVSGEHFARFDGLKHGAEIAALVVHQPDVNLERAAVEPLGLGDFLGALGERLGQIAPRQP